ncbi:hypothetical protein CRG98_020211 [Punica granatum]|uniref:Uncharacterized protein n=1 Tax=Punica granatum TaxID=22663 RepID=A0A2I0JTZ5_PUNGR|nr:hypothetical protein CRG98_020211 [Punica granatum]
MNLKLRDLIPRWPPSFGSLMLEGFHACCPAGGHLNFPAARPCVGSSEGETSFGVSSLLVEGKKLFKLCQFRSSPTIITMNMNSKHVIAPSQDRVCYSPNYMLVCLSNHVLAFETQGTEVQIICSRFEPRDCIPSHKLTSKIQGMGVQTICSFFEARDRAPSHVPVSRAGILLILVGEIHDDARSTRILRQASGRFGSSGGVISYERRSWRLQAWLSRVAGLRSVRKLVVVSHWDDLMVDMLGKTHHTITSKGVNSHGACCVLVCNVVAEVLTPRGDVVWGEGDVKHWDRCADKLAMRMFVNLVGENVTGQHFGSSPACQSWGRLVQEASMLVSLDARTGIKLCARDTRI